MTTLSAAAARRWNRMRGLALLCLPLILSAACGTRSASEGQTVTDRDFPAADSLRGEVCELAVAGNPTKIDYVDATLILRDNESPKNLSLYAASDYAPIRSIISKGRGPGEFILCWGLQHADSLVWLFDLQAGRVCSYATRDLLTSDHPAPLETVAFDGPGVTLALKLNDGRFVASSLREDELLTFYRSDGKRDTLSSGLTSYPFRTPQTDAASRQVRKRVFEYRMKYNARRDRLVVCYCLNDLFEIYRSDGSLHRRVYAPGSHLFDTSRIQSDKLGVLLPEMTFTFEECCLTDERIYLLYNGAGSFLDKSVPTRIYVFDYDGNPVKYYVLDRKMRSFCVDDRGETLYALADGDDGKQVVRYAL